MDVFKYGCVVVDGLDIDFVYLFFECMWLICEYLEDGVMFCFDFFGQYDFFVFGQQCDGMYVLDIYSEWVCRYVWIDCFFQKFVGFFKYVVIGMYEVGVGKWINVFWWFFKYRDVYLCECIC